MKDKRDELIPKQLSGYTWDMTDYEPKVPLSGGDGLTMRDVRNAFQLMPEPPEMELNTTYGKPYSRKILSIFPSSCIALSLISTAGSTVSSPAAALTAMTPPGFWTTSWKSCKCCFYVCRGSTRSRKRSS